MRAPSGERYPMGGEPREIVAPERLVFTTGALDEKGEMMFEFLHTATFVEQNGKTKLTLNSRILKTTADANKYIGGSEAGMTQSLDRLDDLLQNQPFVIERTFDAPVALVWRAITTKEDLRRWYFDLKEFRPEAGFGFSSSSNTKAATLTSAAESPRWFRKRKSPIPGGMKDTKPIL